MVLVIIQGVIVGLVTGLVGIIWMIVRESQSHAGSAQFEKWVNERA